MEKSLQAFDGMLREAGFAVAFTGAGVSEESGIPTFRGRGGLWEEYPPAVYGNLPGLALAFLLRKKRLAGFASGVVSALAGASPNPCHVALAVLEKAGLLRGVITQNIDDLHTLAGSEKVCELHGNALRLRCTRCRSTRKLRREDLRRVEGTLARPGMTRRGLWEALKGYAAPCPECGGRTRPDVVFFGEGLPPGVLEESVELASRCDLLLVLGTTALVHPAAMVPRVALDAGARLVEVDPNPTPLSARAHLRIPYPCGQFFAAYLARGGADGAQPAPQPRRQ